MGLFDSVRGALGGSGDDEPELTDDVPRPANHGEPTPTDFRNKAVDAVQQWDATDLNFSLSSLPRLDTFADRQGAVLDVMHEDRGDDTDIARMHTGYTIQAGSYFGEVLVREAGGDWTRAGEAWAVQVPTGESETIVDVFEVAAHSFAEGPIFVETVRELGIEIETEDDEEDDAEPEGPDVRPEMRETAESVADTWDAYDLDFSPASVVRLDDLLEREFDPYEFDGVDVTGDDMEAKMYRERLKQLGSYFGEVLVRHLDGEWSRRDGEVVVDVSAGRDGWVTVPVFDVAGEGLRGAPRFVLEYNRCIEDAGVDAKPVDPSEPANDADHDASLDTGVPDAATDATADRGTEPAPASATPADAAAGGPDEEPATEHPDADESTPEPEHAAAERAPDSPRDSDARTTRGEPPEHDPTEPEQTPATDPADATRQADPADGREEPADEVPESEQPAADDPPSTDEEYDPDPARGADDDAVAAAADALAGGDEAPSTADADESPGSVAGESRPAVDEGETLDLGGGGGGPEPLTAADVTEDARQFAATWPGYDLDFSPKSLERLDRLVREEYDTDAVPRVELDGTGVDDSYLTARIVETGGYFAEVLRRSVGGEWREGEALAFVIGGRRGETRLDPVAIAADCFDGAESFAAAYADVRNSVGASAGSDGR
jgi:hypothetical protein